MIPRCEIRESEIYIHFGIHLPDDDDDVYYPKERKPREDEEGEESYEKQRQRPGGRGLDARSCASTGRKDVEREVKGIEKMSMLTKA